MQNYRNLKIWWYAHAITLAVYADSVEFPREERSGLTSQMRRAAASVAANIAEGCGRDGDAEFRRFLQMAMGSAVELDYHLLLARDLGFLAEATYDIRLAQLIELQKMLRAFIARLRAAATNGGQQSNISAHSLTAKS